MPIEKTRLTRVGRPMNAPMTNTATSDGHRQDGDDAAESGDLLLQRRRRVGRALGETRNAAEDGVHAGREHQRLRFAGRHRRAGQQHVPASQQVIVVADAGVPRHRPRLSGHASRCSRARRMPRSGGSRPARCRRRSTGSRRRERHPRTGITTTAPSRCALTWCGSRRWRAAIVSSARYSCQNEKTPLTTITPTMAAASVAIPCPGICTIGHQGQHRRHPQERGEEVRELRQRNAWAGRPSRKPLDAIGSELELAPRRRATGRPVCCEASRTRRPRKLVDQHHCSRVGARSESTRCRSRLRITRLEAEVDAAIDLQPPCFMFTDTYWCPSPPHPSTRDPRHRRGGSPCDGRRRSATACRRPLSTNPGSGDAHRLLALCHDQAVNVLIDHQPCRLAAEAVSGTWWITGVMTSRTVDARSSTYRCPRSSSVRSAEVSR